MGAPLHGLHRNAAVTEGGRKCPIRTISAQAAIMFASVGGWVVSPRPVTLVRRAD